MGRALILSLVILAVMSYGVVKMAFPPYEKVAELRVTNMLSGMKEGGTSANKQAQTAMSMWARGTAVITDNSTLNWASDNFDKWRQARKLYRKIDSYTIDKVELVPNMPQETARVTFTIDSARQHVVDVPKDQAMRWVE